MLLIVIFGKMRFMKRYILLACLLCAFSSPAQVKVKVYLLATYHMGGTSDPVKVNMDKDNILGPERQRQVNTLLDLLERSGVEKIYVESQPDKQVFWDSIYREYYAGRPVTMRNEIYQIGIRLAKRLGITGGVTCVDWGQYDGKRLGDKHFADYSLRMQRLADSLNINEKDEFTGYDKMVLKELDALNDNIPSMDLVSVYRTLNSPEYLSKFLYANITTFLDKNTEGMGAFWSQYNMMRNANIYSNIIRSILAERPGKVMVIFGAGHVQALKDMFRAHPAIEVVEINTLLEND